MTSFWELHSIYLFGPPFRIYKCVFRSQKQKQSKMRSLSFPL
uniref:Uncharacterized protein n=1 Tax=Anguilla anguilla TaxID=7936 RepID=A0A0E9PMK0_ANGAN